MGSGIKKPIKEFRFNKLQKEVYDYCFNDYNAPLNFANTCCWVNCNGLTKYSPYTYQRHMIWNCHNSDRNIYLVGRQQGKCSYQNTTIRIRNKKSGEIRELSIKKLFDMVKK